MASLRRDSYSYSNRGRRTWPEDSSTIAIPAPAAKKLESHGSVLSEAVLVLSPQGGNRNRPPPTGRGHSKALALIEGAFDYDYEHRLAG